MSKYLVRARPKIIDRVWCQLPNHVSKAAKRLSGGLEQLSDHNHIPGRYTLAGCCRKHTINDAIKATTSVATGEEKPMAGKKNESDQLRIPARRGKLIQATPCAVKGGTAVNMLVSSKRYH